MIDHEKERLLSLGQAAKRLPKRSDMKPVHPNTVARWARDGLHGKILETILIGGRRFTSVEACQRFFERLSGDPTVAEHARPPLPVDVQRRSSEAEAALIKAGF
jgi:uncharacterized protein YcbX